MRVTLKRSLMSIALSLFTIGNLSSFTALTAVLAGIGILSTLQSASAQTISGDGYTATRLTYSFEDISSTGTGILANQDNNTSSIKLPFVFRFFNVNYNTQTDLFISTNGLLSFGSAYPNANNESLTSLSTAIPPTIAVLWDDLTFNTATNPDANRVYYQTLGSGNSERLVIQWDKAGVVGETGANKLITFQAILYKNDDKIRFNYLDTLVSPGSPANAAGLATVGISNGQVGGQRLQWSYNTPFSSYQTSICFNRGVTNPATPATCP